MTVSELIKQLQKYEDDQEVLVTWESTVHEIEPDNIYLGAEWRDDWDAQGVYFEECRKFLFIDADDNLYKASFRASLNNLGKQS